MRIRIVEFPKDRVVRVPPRPDRAPREALLGLRPVRG